MNSNLKVQCKLIGLTGHAGVGKDTVRSYLHKKYPNTWGLAFADSLKEAAAQLFGIPLDHFYDSQVKEVTNPYWNVSPRQIAQFFGTEMVRDHLHKLLPEMAAGDFWIHRMAVS